MSKFSRHSTMGGLVITCKVGEKVVINHGEIKIEIVDTKGKQVRLCFKANKEILIQRDQESESSQDL